MKWATSTCCWCVCTDSIMTVFTSGFSQRILALSVSSKSVTIMLIMIALRSIKLTNTKFRSIRWSAISPIIVKTIISSNETCSSIVDSLVVKIESSSWGACSRYCRKMMQRSVYKLALMIWITRWPLYWSIMLLSREANINIITIREALLMKLTLMSID